MRSFAVLMCALLAAIQQPRVHEVQLAPAVVQMTVGQSQKLHPLAYDAAGNVIASGVRYGWSSANMNVVKVDTAGTITAVAPGTAVVKAEASGSGTPPKAGAATVTVQR